MKTSVQSPLGSKHTTSILTNIFPCLVFAFCFLLLNPPEVRAQDAILKHSYTFDDGTAKDVAGGADAALNGGKIINGEYVAFSQGQFIVLPADKIALNSYPSLSLEAYLGAGHLNAFFTMFAYFGNSVGPLGTNYLFQSLSNGGKSVTGISCKNDQTPWATSTYVFGNLVNDARYHHVVSTFDNHEIKFYLDGALIDQNTINQFPNNAIANLSNQFAYLCKSGYMQDPTWFGTIDQFNIYEGVLDAATIACSAKKYEAGLRDIPAEIKQMLSDVLVNPGFKPESDLLDTFLQSYKQGKFVVYPTVIRTPDSTAFSPTTGKLFAELMAADLNLNASFNTEILDPGKLEGQGQFDFFNNDMKHLAGSIKEKGTDADYHVILEILFPPRQAEAVDVFGIHILILDKDAENAFSFLLNSHHDYFAYNGLSAANADEANLEALKLKCAQVAFDALTKQLEYAKNK
ncbi:LamG-like jellyroll fold domain-containing protein [Mangrovibacterium diazotrophicum]|uniref:Concanavalin A-like lectin/glucanase superfamily protein n=1 Tax=Mangrovibacterium diazotrophicum TaxID=1261403 RepID=A0A419W4U9_9BACT|nr:LamG-like jellyroll fold domain-containing protein [Mangrovibacterium diazotrophicum]RKD90477.1 concanavalin A-like lectin/glucanase superfamily protein [Mangrovibacterium diazotrophicum]